MVADGVTAKLCERHDRHRAGSLKAVRSVVYIRVDCAMLRVCWLRLVAIRHWASSCGVAVRGDAGVVLVGRANILTPDRVLESEHYTLCCVATSRLHIFGQVHFEGAVAARCGKQRVDCAR